MGYDQFFAIKTVVAALVFVLAGCVAFATTVPAGSMMLSQRVPGQTVCHWAVNSGGLYTAGSDMHKDICHCGSFCAGYAQGAERGGKSSSQRWEVRRQRRWGQGRGFARSTAFRVFQTTVRTPLGTEICRLNCRSHSDGAAGVGGQAVITALRPVPLPASYWGLLLGLACLLGGRRLGQVRKL